MGRKPGAPQTAPYSVYLGDAALHKARAASLKALAEALGYRSVSAMVAALADGKAKIERKPNA